MVNTDFVNMLYVEVMGLCTLIIGKRDTHIRDKILF